MALTFAQWQQTHRGAAHVGRYSQSRPSPGEPRFRSLPEAPETLFEALPRAARHFAHRGIGIVDSRGRSVDRRSYSDFLASVRLAAGRFTALGLEPGDRVLICLPTSWQWLESWFGAFWAGGWPVAIAPPGALGSPTAQVERVDAVRENLNARFLICSSTFKQETERLGLTETLDRALTPEALAATQPTNDLPVPASDPQATAFLQLTSGSTGIPRAIPVTHRGLIHNTLASTDGIGAPHGARTGAWADSMVCWLPLYHDMGLIGCVIYSMIDGLDCWLLSPRSFLARPQVWLQTLAQAGLAISPGPNFAFHMCVERLDPRKVQGLDLSGWKGVMLGAEMVRPETMNTFLRTFSSLGISPQALRPCYGLAETTLSVTFDCKGEGLRTQPVPKEAELGLGLSEVTCVGVPIPDTDLRIAAPDGSARHEGQIGEVWVRGPGVFAGYYEDDQATAEVFRDNWFLTGDLGFLHQGELYLTGRSKEILIIRGQNLMPHDIEWLAEGVTGGGGAQRCGAFSIARGERGEEAVLVMEVKNSRREHLAEMRREITSRVGRDLSLPLADLVFVRRGKVPRTTSGKIKRRELRQLYLEERLERIE